MQLKPLPPLPLKNSILEIDNGFIEKLVTCPRSLLYNNLLKRIFAGEKAALNFGKALHKALEARYLRCTNEPPDVLTETDIYNEVLVPHFQEFPQPEGDHRDLSYAFEIFQRYNQTYAHEPFNLLVNEETGDVATEVSFSVPFGTFSYENLAHDTTETVQVNYTGRIDLPVIWDKSVFVGDFKTSSMLGPKFFDGQKVSAQYEGYAWALEQTLKRPCGGFFIRALRTNPKPMKPQKGWDVWWSESLMTHKEYIRPGQLVEWKENTTRLLELFFHMYSSGYMPQYKKACTMYGKCQFYDVCYLPQEQRGQMLASEEFTDNNWSPLD